MKNIYFLSLFAAIFLISCNKSDISDINKDSFNEKMEFTFQGKSYSSEYLLLEDGTFVWKDSSVGVLYENLLNSQTPKHIVGDVVKFLNNEEANKLMDEVQTQIKSAKLHQDNLEIGTKSKKEISAYRLSIYEYPNFMQGATPLLLNVTRRNINLVEKDVVTYFEGQNIGYARSLSFVVLRTSEESFYPKTTARLVLEGENRTNSVVNNNIIVFDTEIDKKDIIKHPEIKHPNLKHLNWDQYVCAAYVAIF